MLSLPMPFRAVPCHVWLAHDGERDAYGNRTVTYDEVPDYVTWCCYAPSSGSAGDASTIDDIEEGRPRGDQQTLTFYLPKAFAPKESLREALIAALPPDDPTVSGRAFRVVGDPVSYDRANVPGDYSWVIRGVAHLG